MNIFKRIYCRVVQWVFRVAAPCMPYREPKLLSSIDELPGLLLENGVRAAMLVTDRGVRAAGLTRPLEEGLLKSGIRTAVYDGTCANPTVKNVEEARELYITEGCECLIAFGGGSAIDCAKALGARIAYPKKSLDKLKGLLHVTRKIPTLIAIPTTAGTGSEVTLAAVITDSEEHHKYTLMDFNLIPRYAVLDPGVTLSLPKELTATTGMDALTHATEAYIGGSTTKKSRKAALEAVRLIFENLYLAYKDGSDRQARENMLKASYLAGVAFSRSYVGYVHAVAHSLGGQYNIPHGLANATLMPIVLEAYGKTAHKKLYELAVAAGVADKEDGFDVGAGKYTEAIRELNLKMGIPQRLRGIREEDIPKMAHHASVEANPLYPVPTLMDEGELEGFYYKVMEQV